LRWLTTPLVVILVLGFILPVGMLISKSIYDPTLLNSLPQTINRIDQDRYQALAEDLSNEYSRPAIRYVNHYYVGSRSMFIKARKNIDTATAPYKEWFIEQDPRWQDPKFWQVIYNHSNGFTLTNLKKSFTGVYWSVLANTLLLGALITFTTLIIAYPTAWYLTTIKNKTLFTFSLFCILLPFFSSYLSRLVAWLVLLQSNGIINNMTEEIVGLNLDLIYNTTGIFIGSVYILLPLSILPLYAVMKDVSPYPVYAAKTCGASRITTFIKVYLPQTMPGIYNAALLTFMTVIGFYTTPALLGGNKGKFVTEQIVYHMETSLNWGLASALTASLSAIVLILFAVYARLNRA